MKSALLGTRHPRKEKEAALQNVTGEPACQYGKITMTTQVLVKLCIQKLLHFFQRLSVGIHATCAKIRLPIRGRLMARLHESLRAAERRRIPRFREGLRSAERRWIPGFREGLRASERRRISGFREGTAQNRMQIPSYREPE